MKPRKRPRRARRGKVAKITDHKFKRHPALPGFCAAIAYRTRYCGQPKERHAS